MNQQRSRRFRAAQDAKLAKEEKQNAQEEALKSGSITQAQYDEARAEATGSWRFDSNSITPGTQFMDAVAKSLRWYAYQRLTHNPAWKDVQVIISDANVPGEGEHKIMDYIRRQRNTPHYDPNTKHVLCGLDADLIMLGLATHEPHFYILREFVAFGKRNENERFAREGGQAEVFHPYQFLRLNVLREYLAVDLFIPHLPFKWDIERAIDDYVFLCFFVGNDFLPHMPTLEIREGAIELLIETYKKVLPSLEGFITESGEIILERAEVLLREVGKLEGAILKRRKERNQQRQRRDYYKERQMNRSHANVDDPTRFDGMTLDFRDNPRKPRGANKASEDHGSGDNQSAAQQLKNRMTNSTGALETSQMKVVQEPAGQLRASADSALHEAQGPMGLEQITGFESNDTIRLGDEGWEIRYYEEKFQIDLKAADHKPKLAVIAREYMQGLVWVLRYYYQGCCSWNWYYPYHYAPFAADLIDLPSMLPWSLALGTPFKPFEQLMGVLPAASGECLPEPYRKLMSDPTSPIIDFYPEDFKLDMNGKKQSWHAIVLLPFIEEKRLLDAVEPISRCLSEEERFRNTIGNDIYVISKEHSNAKMILELQDQCSQRAQKLKKEISSEIDVQNTFLAEEAIALDSEKMGTIAGSVTYSLRIPQCGSDVDAPLIDGGVIRNIQTAGAIYHNPQYGPEFQFPANILSGVSMPEPLLTADDRKRPALFAPGAPASVMLDAVLNSFRGGASGGRGGRGGRGGHDRGGPMRHGDRNDRSGPYDRNHGGHGGGHGGNGGGRDYRGGRGRNDDRPYNSGSGGRGGYNNNNEYGGYNDRNGGYSNRGGGGGGGYNDHRGGGRHDNYRGGYDNNRGGRGGHHSNNYGGRGGYDNYNGGYGHQQGYNNAPGGGYPPQQQGAPFYSHQGYAPPPGYGSAPPPQNQYPGGHGQQPLSASLAPMLAASAQALGVHHNYFQPAAQGSFQTSNVNLQQLYQQQQQQNRGGRH